MAKQKKWGTIADGHSEKGMNVNKQKILDAIAGALDELDKEQAHLVLNLDIRSLSNERIIAEVHLCNGELAFFHLYAREYSDRQTKAAAKMRSDTYPLHT